MPEQSENPSENEHLGTHCLKLRCFLSFFQSQKGKRKKMRVLFVHVLEVGREGARVCVCGVERERVLASQQ